MSSSGSTILQLRSCFRPSATIQLSSDPTTQEAVKSDLGRRARRLAVLDRSGHRPTRQGQTLDRDPTARSSVTFHQGYAIKSPAERRPVNFPLVGVPRTSSHSTAPYSTRRVPQPTTKDTQHHCPRACHPSPLPSHHLHGPATNPSDPAP